MQASAVRVAKLLQASVSHRRTVPSSPVVARGLPSGATRTDGAMPVWSLRVHSAPSPLLVKLCVGHGSVRSYRPAVVAAISGRPVDSTTQRAHGDVQAVDEVVAGPCAAGSVRVMCQNRRPVTPCEIRTSSGSRHHSGAAVPDRLLPTVNTGPAWLDGHYGPAS